MPNCGTYLLRITRSTIGVCIAFGGTAALPAYGTSMGIDRSAMWEAADAETQYSVGEYYHFASSSVLLQLVAT